MSDGWGPMLMEAAESAGNMIMAALSGLGEMVGGAVMAAKNTVGSAVGAIAAAPANAGRAISLNVSAMADKVKGNGGVAMQKSPDVGVSSFMPQPAMSQAAAAMQSMPSLNLDSIRNDYGGPEGFDHGVSMSAMPMRSQGAARVA